MKYQYYTFHLTYKRESFEVKVDVGRDMWCYSREGSSYSDFMPGVSYELEFQTIIREMMKDTEEQEIEYDRLRTPPGKNKRFGRLIV